MGSGLHLENVSAQVGLVGAASICNQIAANQIKEVSLETRSGEHLVTWQGR